MSNSLLELQHTLSQYGLLISFSGTFTQEIIEELGEAVKKYLETEERPKTDIYNVFSIFIEQTQNIKNYCMSQKGTETYEQISSSCIITIGRSGDGNYISSGNLVLKENVSKLAGILDQLNGLDKADLKKLYKEKLKQEAFSDQPGAGIGLVDIARKAAQPLEYTFTPVDAQFSFFTLRAVV
ncbi:SiaB family protein kinase [Paenibacillus piri]|uniref:Uncharacterized protein n=1 Tax=Paenibacillus piri TaxID=2547395 RepID=A0A4V2ZTK9_9BACL|nr:SiaB family protein kinase [Paenibacillus piri]TDF97494.1 hypothetical protein E1757_12795 [Paenibacillus piri]